MPLPPPLAHRPSDLLCSAACTNGQTVVQPLNGYCSSPSSCPSAGRKPEVRMIDHAYLPSALLAMRCACHLLIALRIFAYKPNNQRAHRHFIGLVAALFGGLNMMERS